MNRQERISRLVARKLQATGTGRIGCVPCFGAAGRVYCIVAAPQGQQGGTARR